MSRLRYPDAWFLIAVLVVAGGGAVLLAQPVCTPVDDRAAEYYWAYAYWRCAFDALSAACGVGLLLRDFATEYSPIGRWVLTGIGLAGAALYILAVLAALRRMGASLTIWAAPPSQVVLVIFTGLLAVSAGSTLVVSRFAHAEPSTTEALRAGMAAFASLGLADSAQTPPGSMAITVAAIAWIGALGWPIWLFLVPALTRKHIQARHALIIAGAYTAWLLLLSGLICVLELPRFGAAARSSLATQPAPTRIEYGRRVVQVISAAGAGVATEPLAGQQIRDGAKVTLALAVLIGSCGCAAGGGVTWMLLIWGLAGAMTGGSEPARARAGPWLHGGLSCAVLMGLLAVGGALGLMVIENLIGSRFEHPPSFADALVDACSAAGGANLTTGLTARVTAENLTSGKNLPVNLYSLGMVWMMALMLAGRMIPLFVLRRAAWAVTPD
jgi:hypothetical protein